MNEKCVAYPGQIWMGPPAPGIPQGFQSIAYMAESLIIDAQVNIIFIHRDSRVGKNNFVFFQDY